MAQRVLEELSAEQCFALLAEVRVGRLVYLDDLGPVAIPVNFALAGNDILVRVEGGTKRAAMAQPHLAFEVDRIDEEEHAGWSVLVRGTGEEIALDHVPELLRGMHGHFPSPWATGVHNVWLRITPQSITGRRLGAEAPVALLF